MPLFCRHNRFTADCPICSKGTVLDPERDTRRRPRPGPRGTKGRGQSGRGKAAAGPAVKGPYVSAGPYGDHEVRLERVPGGLRLAAWSGGSILRRAPAIALDDLQPLIAGAAEKGLMPAEDAERLRAAGLPRARAGGASPGRAGELREELRAEVPEEGRLRIGRWILRPGRGWELQAAPVMLPAARYVEALERLLSGRPDPARH